MNKEELIKFIAEKASITTEEATEALEKLTEAITSGLEEDKDSAKKIIEQFKEEKD